MDKVTASDSECDVLSSGDELDNDDDLWELEGNEGVGDDGDEDGGDDGDEDGSNDDNDGDGIDDDNDGDGGDVDNGDDGDDGDGDDDDDDDDDDESDNGDYDVPLINRKTKKSKKKYKFEKKRQFVPPQLPPFIPEPEMPTPDDRIPVEYVNMFLTDDMIENLVLESNKYATEKTGSCPT